MSARDVVGRVATPGRPHELEGTSGVTFEIWTAAPDLTVTLPVFVTHRNLPARLDLAAGAELRVAGELRGGVLRAIRVSQEGTGRFVAQGEPVGAVTLTVPSMIRLDRGRRRVRGILFAVWLVVIVVVGSVGAERDDNRVGAVAMALFLGLCAWLVVDDLRSRRRDDREQTDLARTVSRLVLDATGRLLPERALFTILGAGRLRTGNPWRPSRDLEPQPVVWLGDAERLCAGITPLPLRAGEPATITVARLPH